RPPALQLHPAHVPVPGHVQPALPLAFRDHADALESGRIRVGLGVLHQSDAAGGRGQVSARSQRQMNVLHVCSEVAPLAKTGGLADVLGALPKALTAHGVHVTVVAPRYGFIDPEQFSLARRLRTVLGCTIYEGRMPGSNVGLYLVDHPPSFGRAGLYGEAG